MDYNCVSIHVQADILDKLYLLIKNVFRTARMLLEILLLETALSHVHSQHMQIQLIIYVLILAAISHILCRLKSPTSTEHVLLNAKVANGAIPLLRNAPIIQLIVLTAIMLILIHECASQTAQHLDKLLRIQQSNAGLHV